MREYSKNGKSLKFQAMHSDYKAMVKSEVNKYKEKLMRNIKDGNTGSIYKNLRRSGDCPGKKKQQYFQIESHKLLNLSYLQSAERILSFFSDISQEYSQ